MQNNHQLAPWTWCRAVRSKKSTFQLLCARRRPRLEPTMHPGVTGNDGNGDLQKSQHCVIETINVCKKHDRIFSPFEFTESHPLFLRIDWHFERKFWGVTTSQSPVPNCFDSRGVLRQQDSGFFHAGHLPGQNNVKCEPTALEKTIRRFAENALSKPPNKMFHTLGR